MLRVVQWATGPVGSHALAALVEHPELEVAGVLVYSDEKVGRDAGEVCGIGPIGIETTRDRGDILALEADCALYMAKGEMSPMTALATRSMPSSRWSPRGILAKFERNSGETVWKCRPSGPQKSWS